MVITIDGKSEICENIWSEIGNLICLWHLLRATAVTIF